MTPPEIPKRYQPSERLVDDRDRLRELYCHRGLTIREIASEYAEVGRTRVCDAIHDHDLNEAQTPEHDTNERNTDRGTDPPTWVDFQ